MKLKGFEVSPKFFLAVLSLSYLLLLGGAAMAFQIESPAFQENSEIPGKYACDGEDLSPPLAWREVPQGTKSFALIADDPDAPVGTWVHWVIYNLPPEAQELAEGLPKTEKFPEGSEQGVNDFRRVGYDGPCPPPGPAHRYFFKLYALDAVLQLPPQAEKSEVLTAAQGHILAQAELVGRYQRNT